MARKRYQSRQKKNGIGIIALIFLIILVAVWLILSIVKGVNPMKVFTTMSSKDQEEPQISYDSLSTLFQTSLNEIGTLRSEIDFFKQSAPTKIVDMNNGTLNMREMPTLDSGVLVAIPSDDVVKVYYCSPDSSIVEGKKGTWCKVLFNDQEGWVWSEYLK